MKRPYEISTAAVLLVLAALASLILPLLNIGVATEMTLPANTSELPAGSPDMGQVVAVVRGVTIGMQVLGLVANLLAGFGLWRLRKWGYWLAMILALLMLLGAAPVLFNRAIPLSPWTFAQLAVGVIVLIFLWLKDSRAAFFPAR